MKILRQPSDAAAVADPGIRALVEQRFEELTEPGEMFNANEVGFFLLVEPGDQVSDIEKAAGVPILHGLFDDSVFGDADFTPCAEAIDAHPGLYELVYVTCDGGCGTIIFLPRQAGVDPQLLAMAAQFVTSPPPTP